jgi:myosin-5
VQDKDSGWLPAHVLKQDGDSVQVRVFSVDETETLGERTISLKDYPNEALPFQNVDASGKLMEMADMVDLPSLHEAAILYNLRTRHMDHKPYTRVGDLIVAVNPFKVCCAAVVWFPHGETCSLFYFAVDEGTLFRRNSEPIRRQAHLEW